MKNKTVVLKKLLSLTLVGSFALSPVLMSPSASADPPRHAPAWGYRGKDHRGNRKDMRTLTGRVTRVESDFRFSIRVDNKEYKVTLSRRKSQRLNRNDLVRVYGYVSRNNDIRDATVLILKDKNRPGERYQTFVGVVTKVKSNSEFDMRFEGKTYNVYLSGSVPRRLSNNDRVSVYGSRVGNNDIRNASVRVLGRR